MGFQQSSLILAITIISISLYTSSSLCERSCGAKKVPYPFGFSEDCLIRLICKTTNTTGDGDIKIGDFHVQNITKDAILVNLPPKCNRSIESIRTLFGHNYGLSKLNGLLLQNCKHPVNGCVIPRSSFPTGTIDDCDTKADNNLSCFSLPDNSSNGIGFLSFEKIMDAHCMFVFSSFAVESVTTDQVVSLEFQRIHLDWWIYEDCKRNPDLCSKDGNCSMIQTPQGTPGFRCSCNDGFVGDGFARGESCRRVSDSGCNPSKYISGKCGETTRIGVLVGGLVAGALLMIGLLLLCYFVKRRSISLRNQSSAKRLLCQAAGNSSVSFYQYKEIERATNCFSEKQRLGTGAYGTVYAGKLRDYEWVAIKRIRHRDTNSIDQVMNEIKLLSSVSHPNLVRLLGCCIEETEPILIYEFMPNGTLCQHLQRERGKGLPWTIRLTIATETANAIAYLHSAMNPPIFHRDIKSSNILLDYNYRSKVADFGLSRVGMPESSHISTAPQGTPGYLDPQYHQYFHLSDKSDVYSFGVVLVEIVTGLKVVDFSRPHSEVNLAALAIDRIGRGCIDEIIDPFLDPHRDAWTLSSIHNVAELAFRCLAFHRDMRPTMTEVAEELEQIRLSAWMPNMCLASQSASSCNSLDNGSMRSFSIASTTKIVSGSQRLFVQEKTADCFTPPAEEEEEEIKDNSPVSVQDYWLSEQSSPSTNSLLGNVVQ